MGKLVCWSRDEEDGVGGCWADIMADTAASAGGGVDSGDAAFDDDGAGFWAVL